MTVFYAILNWSYKVKPAVHLRSESEINVDRIFKDRVHLRGLYHYREPLRQISESDAWTADSDSTSNTFFEKAMESRIFNGEYI